MEGGREGEGRGEGRGGAKLTMDIGNLNLRRNQVRKAGKISLKQSLIYNDFRQTVQRIDSVALPL